MSQVVVHQTSFNGRQWRLAAMFLVLTVIALGILYFWFLRTDYQVLVQGIRPQEAATIVDELKKEDVAYQLRDGGTTILVPASQLNATRLNVSANELPLKGTVGFELFNESDMGVTDFAQKVNYQRALQGEIARTIMSMDGIAYARVHLALPERSLFRATRSQSRAAVTLTPKHGILIDADRIAGIQRLVAATVPDLALDQVAVLNAKGQLLTPQFTDVGGGHNESEIEYNYSQRVSRTVAAAAPNAHLDVKVTVVSRAGTADLVGDGSHRLSVGQERDHSIRLVLFSRSPLSQPEEAAIRQAVTQELSLNASAGDQLQFSPTPQMASPLQATAVAPAADTFAPNSDRKFMEGLARNWSIAFSIFAVLVVLFMGARVRKVRVTRRADLTNRLRQHLLTTQRNADVA